MTGPSLVSPDALAGRRIAISVSDSADLERLGLSPKHCQLVVAEVGRAIMLAGGTVVYGGNLRPGGFTYTLIEEALRFSDGRQTLEITLAESEHRKLDESELLKVDRSLGDIGRLTLLTRAGEPVSRSGALAAGGDDDPPAALTAMRQYVTNTTTARLIVGGRLTGYSGREPGVIEEARLTIQAGYPLFAAGGYGGAAAAVAHRLRPHYFDSWAPEGYPMHADDAAVCAALDTLEATFRDADPETEFDEGLLRTLTISHRPADIASATVRLLSS